MDGDRDAPPRVASPRRDLNGRPVIPGRWERLRAKLRTGRADAGLAGVDAADLVVVAESDDDAVASSAVLDAATWRPDDEVVLRHVLRLAADRVDEAARIAGLDGYERLDAADAGDVSDDPDTVVLVLARRQLLDALHLSQERSRMAGLGARHGGTVTRWQVLQRPVARG